MAELKAKPITISFPNEMASNAEKESLDYGLAVAKAIEGEWFGGSGNTCRFYSRAAEFHKRRLYARGEQPIQKYKDIMSVNGDNSHLNLNWEIVKVIPRFVDIVVNGMNDRLYAIKAESQDISTAEKKNLFQEMVETEMLAKDFLKQTKDQFGIDASNIPEQEVPETDEELSLYMQLKFKPSVEIAEEVAINTLLEMNGYKDSIKPLVDYDQVVLGVGVVQHTFQPGGGVVIDYQDPAEWVHSYTERTDFSDTFYNGGVRKVHYSELRKINPRITDTEMAAIRKAGSAWYNTYPQAISETGNAFDNELITVLFFDYTTEKNFTWKKKYLKDGGVRVSEKPDTFNPVATEDTEDRFEKISTKKQIVFEGVLVLGSDILIKWEAQTNLIRPEAASQKAVSSFVACAPRMYKGNIESLVSRMIPHADSIQLTTLKLQQVKSRMVPDGIAVDVDALSEIDLGDGGKYTATAALDMYFQTGSVLVKSYTQDGEFNQAKTPIQELTTSSGQSKIATLVNLYNFELNMIRDVTGLNEARDGSMPNPNSLVGLQKLAALSSNTATKHVLDAGLSITKRLATCLSLRIADLLKNEDFREEFAMQIGKYNLAILEDIKNLYLHSFGIFIELEPDQEEKAQLEANIQVSLAQQTLDLEDAIDIRMIKNLKMANEMLKIRRKKKLKAAQDREDMQSQIQMQMNMQTQQAAAEQKQQTAQIDAQAKISIKEAEAQFAVQLLAAEVESKKELMALEFDYNMQLKGIETSNLEMRDSKKEEAKDKRVDIQATAQSKLIDQRKNNLPPVDFESSEDSMDGFSLESFSPR